MKISPQVYADLKNGIRVAAKHLKIDIKTADGGKTGLKAIYVLLYEVSANYAYDDSHPRWQFIKRCLPYDGRDYCFYYADNCNDSHVQTALKKIKQELIAENLTV